jgi:lysyl-tRNA synthetase class 2
MLFTNNSSIQEVLFFPQMRPEKFEAGPDFNSLKAIGVPELWLEFVAKAGFKSAKELHEQKPTAVHQKLNGFRKKNKLDLPALQLDEVERWF